MGDRITADQPDGVDAIGPRVDAPPMPVIRPLWRDSIPYLLVDRGQRYSLGWQDTRKHGSCFVVVRFGGMPAQKVLDRFPLTEDGWANAWAALVELDAAAAKAVLAALDKRAGADAALKAEQERQTSLFEAFVNAGGATVFRALGVQVLAGGDQVYTIGFHDLAAKVNTSRLLGPLAGAEAMVTDGSQAWSPGRAMFLPIGLTGLATKTVAHAAVVFPDGTVHTAALDGNSAVRDAQLQVVQFNALAGAHAPGAANTESDPAIRLRKLQELRDAGLLSQEEYETKRAEVIQSI